MKGEKLVFERQNVANLFVPTWQELGCKTVWSQAIMIKDFLKYVPDDWRSDHKVERKFFYGILTTLAPMFVQTVVNEAR